MQILENGAQRKFLLKLWGRESSSDADSQELNYYLMADALDFYQVRSLGMYKDQFVSFAENYHRPLDRDDYINIQRQVWF